MFCQTLQQRDVWVGFDEQFQNAATGQAEVQRFVAGGAVGQGVRAWLPELAAPHLVDQVVFNTAARYRPGYAPVVPHCQPGSARSWRGAPGVGNRGQDESVALMAPALDCG
ncbi:hypothetical protein D3C87_1437370 [compost metagenome]